ncbi:N-acetylmuramoyl-L-alanine amidase [Salegentibacter mishustinae]|uniref:N-acetylmuramoyl-L-alanine amidase n=1 Tax=Salegentibacter mishustinae TaxID=270918 RepID=UPI001CE03E05|nr:N-acetylmuramoyl-L-alanine amidase [Salegentibacter mishustinae]UBZ08825.1 N-acetylmuramoyl-L-alanine amidase [Salegentibacter mishustinae]
MKKYLGFESRGLKFANFQVLRETMVYCLLVLLEFGFMSNTDGSSCYNKTKSKKLWP